MELKFSASGFEKVIFGTCEISQKPSLILWNLHQHHHTNMYMFFSYLYSKLSTCLVTHIQVILEHNGSVTEET